MPNIVQRCTAVPDTIPADNSTQSTITAAIVDDLEGSPLSGVSVFWSADSSEQTEERISITDDLGMATTTLKATISGLITVTATTRDDITGQSVTIEVKELNMNSVEEIINSLPALPADGSVVATLTAVVVDDNGNAASDVEVQWSTDLPGIIEPLTSITDSDGKAVTSLKADGGGLIIVRGKTTEQEADTTAIVIATNPPLADPHVQNASPNDDYTLDSHDIDFGVHLTIPAYQSASASDNVVLYWGEFTKEFPITDPETDLPFIIDIKETFEPEALADGVHSVYYIVYDKALNPSISKGLNITVTNGGHTSETLDAPIIPEVDDNGYINILDASDGVDVEIKYLDMAKDDLITFYWPAFDSKGNPVSAGTISFTHIVTEGESSYKEKIALDYFIFNGKGYEGTVDAYYTVLKSSTKELALSYTKHCRIDTVSP